MWCQEAASLLCICLSLAVPLRSVTSRWLKSPPRMMWSELKSARLILRQSWALSLEERGAYMLIMVNVPLPGDWKVMDCMRPSIKISCAVMSGAVALSTKMAVSALVLCEHPMGMPSFQKALPCQNSIPLAESWMSSFPRWCSWISIIWGGVGSEASQALISFGLVVPPLSPLTLRKVRVRAFLVIGKFVAGSRLAARS